MSDGPKSGPRRSRVHQVAYVLVRVDMVTDDEAYQTHALCAVAAAVTGLGMPGSAVIDVKCTPNDGGWSSKRNNP